VGIALKLAGPAGAIRKNAKNAITNTMTGLKRSMDIRQLRTATPNTLTAWEIRINRRIPNRWTKIPAESVPKPMGRKRHMENNAKKIGLLPASMSHHKSVASTMTSANALKAVLRTAPLSGTTERNRETAILAANPLVWLLVTSIIARTRKPER
jgi:hypothetical protein